MIYLDNSATTLIKPKNVISAVNEALIHYSANPGRSGHSASIRCALKIEETREKLAKHFGLSLPQNVIFTANCTTALNVAIFGYLKKGDHVITTENEHNSVLRPLETLKKEGIIDYDIAFQSSPIGISLEDIKPLVRKNTAMIITNHISNVNGAKANIKEIGQFCKQNNILYLVDSAQSCGHEHINMEKDGINMLAFAGHKGFYAPLAIGGLLINTEKPIKPLLYGGTGTNSLELFQPSSLPERLESGTISSPLILGLNAGVDFVTEHFDEIKYKLDDLTTYLNFELDKLGFQVYTEPENANGVIAFNIEDIDSSEIATILNEKYGICVRGGYHCAPLKHKALKTLGQGAVRVSLSYFNTFTDIQRLIVALKNMKNKVFKIKN